MNKFGIIGAMEVEVEILKKDMAVERRVKKAGMEFVEGTLYGRNAVVVKSGIGKVNAAVCTQILADDFHVDAIINTGIAGSLQASINIGDVVVSTDLVQHDVDCTAFGYPLGQVPQMEIFSIEADKGLAELAKKVCEEVNRDIKAISGRIVSGDQFICDKEIKKKIATNFNGCCTEMEGAAIAQAAYLNGVPFVVLRAISDKADDSANMDYPEFEKLAVRHSVRLVKGLLEKDV